MQHSTTILSTAQQTQLRQLVAANQAGVALVAFGQPLTIPFIGPLLVSIVEQSTLSHWGVVGLQSGVLADRTTWQHPLPLWTARIPRDPDAIPAARERFVRQVLAAQHLVVQLQTDAPAVAAARTLALAEVLAAGRAVISAGGYPDRADAEAIAVPAVDLRALETALVRFAALPAADTRLPDVVDVPIRLHDSTDPDAQPVVARLRVHRQTGIWLMFETPDDREHAAVLIAQHDGAIELKAWVQDGVYDDPKIDQVLFSDLTPLFVTGDAHGQ